MRRVDKELKRVNRNLKQLEDCICTPLCKEGGIIPQNGNGCRNKLECEQLKYHFANNRERVALLWEQRKYLEVQSAKCNSYASC
jgi:hypothetical protein